MFFDLGGLNRNEHFQTMQQFWPESINNNSSYDSVGCSCIKLCTNFNHHVRCKKVQFIKVLGLKMKEKPF